jgi:4-hydroxybenzoate polyprenyltransferase
LGAAWAAGISLTIVTLGLAYFLAPGFEAVLVVYFLLNLAYSQWLKHIPIIDVLVIAAGFVLRVHAGVTLIQPVERFSPWLYVVMTLLALFLGFGKRRAELALLAHGAGSHRKVLDGYTLPLLDQYIMIVSGTTIVAYSLYTFSAPNVPENHSMMLTIPFVIYTIFRYLYLIEVKHAGGAPEEILLSDRPFQAAMILWGLTVLAIFYLS